MRVVTRFSITLSKIKSKKIKKIIDSISFLCTLCRINCQVAGPLKYFVLEIYCGSIARGKNTIANTLKTKI